MKMNVKNKNDMKHVYENLNTMIRTLLDYDYDTTMLLKKHLKTNSCLR